MLSRLVITFLPRSKHLLTSWLQSPSAVILEPKKIKSDTVSSVSPSICHEVKGPSSQVYGFSSGDAFELWCWRILLKSALDFQPVHPKVDQSLVFIGRTDVEAETPILWPPDVKS